jgi:transposase-like protein
MAHVVEDRTQETLMPIIKENVKAGSEIFTDEFRSYSRLSNDVNYTHRTVCSAIKFRKNSYFACVSPVYLIMFSPALCEFHD